MRIAAPRFEALQHLPTAFRHCVPFLPSALPQVTVRAQDGINKLSSEVSLEVPNGFTHCLGSAQFGPFAKIPALPTATTGKLNVVAMPRSSGATTFAKLHR